MNVHGSWAAQSIHKVPLAGGSLVFDVKGRVPACRNEAAQLVGELLFQAPGAGNFDPGEYRTDALERNGSLYGHAVASSREGDAATTTRTNFQANFLPKGFLIRAAAKMGLDVATLRVCFIPVGRTVNPSNRPTGGVKPVLVS